MFYPSVERDLLLRLLRGHEAVRLAHELGQPRVADVRQDHADPAGGPDVGRAEETVGLGRDEDLLLALRRREPQRDVLDAVMVLLEHREDLRRAEGRRAPGDLLGHAGQREAHLPHALELLSARWGVDLDRVPHALVTSRPGTL